MGTDATKYGWSLDNRGRYEEVPRKRKVSRSQPKIVVGQSAISHELSDKNVGMTLRLLNVVGRMPENTVKKGGSETEPQGE
jgi:hypothetical protein